MSVVEGVQVDLEIVLGSAEMPIRQILKMSRGAMIPLNCTHDDPTMLFVNKQLVATGQILLNGDRMSLEIGEVTRSLG